MSLSYDNEKFKILSKGHENEKEKGKRCYFCYLLRLEACARFAKDNNIEYFATTLSVSPLKSAQTLNKIGKDLEEIWGVKYLVSDFKKKDGFKRSIEISNIYGMYRQDYCGCVYSFCDRVMRSKGFIFDMDGTLLESMQFYEHFLSDYLKRYDIKAKPDLREKIRALSVTQAVLLAKKEYDIPKSDEEVVSEVKEIIFEFYANDVTLKDGVLQFLKISHDMGIKMAVASATDTEVCKMALKKLGVLEYFDFVKSTKDFNTSKKEPLIYDKCCELLDLNKNEVAVFEDAYHAIKTCKEAGYLTVSLKDASMQKFEDEIISISDIYIDNMMDLINRENI